MSSLITNMPLLWIVVIVLGIICIMYSIIKITSDKLNDTQDYVESSHNGKEEIKELFSYFLEEEEKRNEDIRNMMKHNIVNNKNMDYINEDRQKQNRNNQSKEIYPEIMEYYNQGKDEEWIAKKLKRGIGEVKLIISLYNMK